MRPENNPVLILDSSNNPLSAAVINNGLLAKTKRKGIKQEDLLFPSINSLLKKQNLKLCQIKEIYVVNGPGRFTGIRLSLTLASVLRELNGAKAFNITAFEVIAKQVMQNAASKNKPFAAAIIHAFKDEYYVQLFKTGSIIKAHGAAQWLNCEELNNYLKPQAQQLYVAGLDANGKSIRSVLGSGYIYAPVSLSRVNIETIALMINENSVNFKNNLSPLYLKPAKFETGAK